MENFLLNPEKVMKFVVSNHREKWSAINKPVMVNKA